MIGSFARNGAPAPVTVPDRSQSSGERAVKRHQEVGTLFGERLNEGRNSRSG